MFSRTKISRSKRAGSSIVIVLIAVITIALLGMAMLQVGLSSRILAIRDCQAMEARCAADAGLVKALYQMNERLRSRVWSDDSMPSATLEALPGAEATFGYTVSGSDSTSYAIQSIGYRNQGHKRVSATVRVKSLFESAILVRDRISLMPNTLISGYNSDDPTDTDIDVKIGTTSIADDRITLGPGTVVDGDAFVGVSGDPATGIATGGGSVNGTQFALEDEIEFPVITAPPLPDMNTGLVAAGMTLTVGPAGSGRYTDITLSQQSGSDGILEIAGGDVALHITGSINMGNGAEVIVRPGSSLTLYVDGDIHANNSGGFNNEAGYVEDFKLFATGTTQVFNLKAKSNLFGAIYAPQVDIEMYPSVEMHGAIVANNVTFKSGCNYYYDEALADASVYDEGARFEIKRWSGD